MKIKNNLFEEIWKVDFLLLLCLNSFFLKKNAVSMKLPLSLIKSLIQIDLPVAEISETLTLLGIEVDGILNEHPSFAKVVVGEVIAVRRHPDAEKLQIAEIGDGSQVYTVVCAAPNCRVGIKTAFAKEGAVLTDADGLQRRIEKSSIRGVESMGMLCTGSELRISEESDGIIELPAEMKAGQDIAGLLWDPVFELSLTPNLGHCMSALGIARELSAALQKPIHRKKTSLVENSASPIEKKIKVTVEEERLSPRYMCRLIEGVKIGPSPFWLRQQLTACGMKPIHNAVDIANYIMMKYGQPLHAFDYARIEGKTIAVSSAKQAMKFKGLDGVDREIPEGAILISDDRKPVAIAGILGSEESSVSSRTSDILLEAAFFDPMSIRIASKKMGLRTESSQRFEKGIDPIGIEEALDEACHLILEICGGKLAKGKIDQKKSSFAPKEIHCRTDRVNQILGSKLSFTEIDEIFHRLSFRTRLLDKGNLQVEVPLFRFDIAEEIDLIEEVARIYGYNNIEKTIPRCTTSQIPHDPAYLFEKEFRNRLLRLGLQEFLNCDLISPQMSEFFKEIASPSVSILQTIYSKSEEYSILRTSLLPGLLQSVKRNLDQKNQTLSAFEIGRIHFMQGKPEKLAEIPMGAILLTGKSEPRDWNRKPSDVDFFDLKGFLENLLDSLKITDYSFQSSHHLSFHPGRQADIHLNGLVIGSLGEVHPSLLEKFDIKQRVLFAELNMQHLMAQNKPQPRMTQLSQFPSSERDWTIPLDIELPIETIFKTVRSIHSPLLERAELIDLYIPESASKKHATFRFTYRDKMKTISFEEVEAEHAKIMQAVLKNGL